MPLLETHTNNKATAIEDATARQIDQYAAFTKGSADDVVEAALSYVFGNEKALQKFRHASTGAKPTIALRMKPSMVRRRRPPSIPPKGTEHSSGQVKTFTRAEIGT